MDSSVDIRSSMSSSKPAGLLGQQLSQIRSIESSDDLTRRQRKVMMLAVALVGLILIYSVIYHLGMIFIEGDDHSYFRSLQTVVETMTTTGYGADAPWESPVVNLLVIWFQLSGVLIGLVTLRILIIPLFERAPVVLDDQLTTNDDHVVVCEYGRGKSVLLDELGESNIEYVLVDSDTDEAIALSNRGYQVIDGDPTEIATLERASVERAAFVVSDARERNATIALTARRLTDDARVICLTETPARRNALKRIGVDRVVCPPALIGRRLARKATTLDLAASADVLGEGIVVRELIVRHGGPLDGAAVGETAVSREARLTIVAAWIDGELRLPPVATDRLTANSVLVVVGPTEPFDRIHEEIVGVASSRRHTSVVVAGFGEGGRAVVSSLPDEADVTTIDDREGAGADVIGDVSEAETLERAAIADATALVVTVDDDETALLATAIGRSVANDIEILVRVTDAENVPKAADAGADYALSEQRTIARMLTTEIRGTGALHPTGYVQFTRIEGTRFAGGTLDETNGRSERGWVGVGVERNGSFHTDGAVEIAPDDTVIVAGTPERLRELE